MKAFVVIFATLLVAFSCGCEKKSDKVAEPAKYDPKIDGLAYSSPRPLSDEILQDQSKISKTALAAGKLPAPASAPAASAPAEAATPETAAPKTAGRSSPAAPAPAAEAPATAAPSATSKPSTATPAPAATPSGATPSGTVAPGNVPVPTDVNTINPGAAKSVVRRVLSGATPQPMPKE